MQQLDVYDVLHTLDDLYIIERDVYKLKANRKLVTETATVVKTHMYYDLYIDGDMKWFMFPDELVEWLRLYLMNN